jgi:hypothetical protein
MVTAIMGLRRSNMPCRASARRVASKYKNKKEVPKADGSGTTTVYEYSPRQVAQRHKQKAVRIESLRKKMSGLRKQALSDLTASDPQTRLTALAVCLMDETYERVGNERSAKEGHHGVTNWTADHITLGGKVATIKYTGKSGVKHEKKVTNARVLSALRKAMKGKGNGDKVLCDGDECSILAQDVNAYLKPYKITAKDIRGLHANEEMKRHLKAQRKAGPADLPRSRKERDKILKAEFQAALDLASAAVGHEASTLRSQYLVPSMEASYVHDGTVIDKLDKKASRTASWMKVKRFFPGVRNPVFHATTGPRAASIAMRGEGIKPNSGVSNFGAGNKVSISLSRDLNFLLRGGFGNVIFVLDRDELNRMFPVNPHAYPNWEDEYEERVFTDKIPPSMIRGVILRYKPLGFELDEWESKVDYPVAYIDGREWGSRTAAAWGSHPDGRLLGYKVMGYDPETRQLISGADSRQRFPLRKGVHRMRAPGIFLGATPSYVLDYYANYENNALLTYAFDAADVTTGNLGDREPEITVPEAELVGWSLYDEDLNPLRTATLSDTEREDREDKAQVRQSPKLKPPRTDKERRLVKDRDNVERDPDADQDQKDRSTNFKDAALRLALVYTARGSTPNRKKRKQQKKKDRGRRVKKERNVRKNNTVRVRKKDTGKIVDVSEETLREQGGEYEQITDTPEAEEETPTEPTPAPAGDKPSLRKFPTGPSEQAALYDQVSGVRAEIKQITDDDPSLWDLDGLKRLYGKEFKAITGQEADSEILDRITAKTEDGQDAVTDQKSLSKVLQKLRQGHSQPFALYKKQEKAFRDGIMEGVPQQYLKAVSGFSAEELVGLDTKITEAQGKITPAATSAGRVALRAKAKRAKKKLGDAKNLTPEKAAQYLVTIQMAEMLDDPDMVVPGKPLSKLTLEKKPAEEVQQMVADRTTSSLSAYRAMSAGDRKTQKAILEERLEDLNDDGHGESEQYAGTLAALRGLALASLIDEDKAAPEAKTLQAILRAADADGSLDEVIQDDFLSIHENESAQGRIRNILEDSDNLTSFLPDDHPTKVLTEFLGDEKNLKGIPKDRIEGLRQQAMDQIMAEVMGGLSTKAPASKTSPPEEGKPSSGGESKKSEWLARAEALRKRMLADLEKLIRATRRRGKSASLINAWDFTSWESCR